MITKDKHELSPQSISSGGYFVSEILELSHDEDKYFRDTGLSDEGIGVIDRVNCQNIPIFTILSIDLSSISLHFLENIDNIGRC